MATGYHPRIRPQRSLRGEPRHDLLVGQAPDPQPYASALETVIKNLRIWHVFNVGVYHYPAARMTFDGLVVRGKDPAASACCGRGWHGQDYAASNIVIRNADIQGMTTGIHTSRVGMGPRDGRELVPAKRFERAYLDARECQWWQLGSCTADEFSAISRSLCGPGTISERLS